MKTFVYLVFTCFISTGSFMCGLNSPSIWPGYLIGFAVWVWFAWNFDARQKRARERRNREKMLNMMLNKVLRSKD